MNHIHLLSKNKTQFSQAFHLFQEVGVQIFHFLSLHKPCFYRPSFLVFFQLIIFHQFFVSKCFCIHDILSKTNQHQSLSLLRLVFLHFVLALSNPSLFVKIFLFLFFSCFWSCFFFWNNVSFKKVSEESKPITPEMVAGCNETTLPILLSYYLVLRKCLPDKSYPLKTEKCSGGKHSKIRITGLASANAVGNKLQMFVIDKAKNPRCFKNIKKLPCRYRS